MAPHSLSYTYALSDYRKQVFADRKLDGFLKLPEYPVWEIPAPAMPALHYDPAAQYLLQKTQRARQLFGNRDMSAAVWKLDPRLSEFIPLLVPVPISGLTSARSCKSEYNIAKGRQEHRLLRKEIQRGISQ